MVSSIRDLLPLQVVNFNACAPAHRGRTTRRRPTSGVQWRGNSAEQNNDIKDLDLEESTERTSLTILPYPDPET